MKRKIKGNGNIISKKNSRVYTIDNNDDEYNNNINRIINKISPSPSPSLSPLSPLSLSPLSRSLSSKRKTKKHSSTLGNFNQVEHDRLVHILGNFGSDVAGLQMVLKRGFEPEAIERMKKEREKLNLNDSNFVNMSIAKMRRICDELYVTNNVNSLYRRSLLLRRLGVDNEPEEFPKHLIDDSQIESRYFWELFISGRKKPSEIYKEFTELEYKPRSEYERRMLIQVANGEISEDDEFLQELLSRPDQLNYSVYIQENERLYYTGMLKALLHPMVGGHKKRRTRRRRKTYRK